MKNCNPNRTGKDSHTDLGGSWRQPCRRAGVFSALLLAFVFLNAERSHGQRKGRPQGESQYQNRTPAAGTNGPGDGQPTGNELPLSRQQTTTMVARLNSEMKKANRIGDVDRALDAALKKLDLALRCRHQLPRVTWARKSCDVLMAVLETPNKRTAAKRSEVQTLLMDAQATLRGIGDEHRARETSELIQIVSHCHLRLKGGLTHADATLVSKAIADMHSYDVEYRRLRDDRSALETLVQGYSAIEKTLRRSEVSQAPYRDVTLRLAECRFLLSDYPAARSLYEQAMSISNTNSNKPNQLADRFVRLQQGLEIFQPEEQAELDVSRWLRELIDHGASLTIEDPTTDAQTNMKLAEFGLTTEKIHAVVSARLQHEGIKTIPVGSSPDAGIHINVTVGAVPNESLGMIMFSVKIDIGQMVLLPSFDSELQFAVIYSPKYTVGLSAIDRFMDDVNESLSLSLNELAAAIESAKAHDRLDRRNRAKAMRERMRNRGITAENFEEYQRGRFLQEIATGGVFVTPVLFGNENTEKKPWFERNGMTLKDMVQIIENRLGHHKIKVVSSVEMNRLALGGKHVCWISPIPLVSNGRLNETELTAYALELSLAHPAAYPIQAGQKPFLGRVESPATIRRFMGSGLGSMRDEFEQDLIHLVDRFADAVNPVRR